MNFLLSALAFVLTILFALYSMAFGDPFSAGMGMVIGFWLALVLMHLKSAPKRNRRKSAFRALIS